VNPQECGLQGHNDRGPERSAPISTCHDIEHYAVQEASCAPLGGDGPSPDKGHLPRIGGVSARSERDDTWPQSLTQEGVAGNHKCLLDQDQEGVGAERPVDKDKDQREREREDGHDVDIDSMRGLGQGLDASRAKVSVRMMELKITDG